MYRRFFGPQTRTFQLADSRNQLTATSELGYPILMCIHMYGTVRSTIFLGPPVPGTRMCIRLDPPSSGLLHGSKKKVILLSRTLSAIDGGMIMDPQNLITSQAHITCSVGTCQRLQADGISGANLEF